MLSKNFKAGKYYIGDLCYVIPNEEWEKLIDEDMFGTEKQLYKGRSILTDYTANGDGIFNDYKKYYAVDSGMIGIVSCEDIDVNYAKNYPKAPCLGHLIKFKEDFTVIIIDGIFKFGDIIIDTN